MIRRSVVLILPLLAAFVLVGPQAARGGTHQWMFPGTDCPTTLQACIDGADPGDVIFLDTNTTIMEDLSITKSLTLRAANGFLPAVQYVNVLGDGSQGALDVTVEDLEVTFDVAAVFNGGTGHTLTLRNVDVEQSDQDSSDAAMSLAASVPATFLVTRSTVHAGRSDNQFAAVEVAATQADGPVVFRAIGDHVTAHGDPESAGGISVESSGTGETTADLYGNSIWSVAQCFCGSAAGITIESTNAGALVANAVGNTIDRSAAEGLEVDSQGPAEGHVTVNAFDDVYARVAHAPIFLDATVDSTLTFRAGHGDFFANGDPNVLAGRSIGTHNLTSNPAFVGETTGNLALKTTSPLVDAGLVCTAGGLADLDAAGHGRLAGASVDMGAFERGAGAPTGKAFVGTAASNAFDGTSGADIMCGFGGDDILLGKSGADWLEGGTGADSIIGGPGPDRLFGGMGDELCLAAHDGVRGNDHVDGGPGTDRFTADAGDHLVSVEHRGGCDA